MRKDLKRLMVIVLLFFLWEVTAEEVPDGTIYGHVYDAQTKQPLSQAFVYCQGINSPKETTDSQGYYAIEGGFIASETYFIECAKYGYKSDKKSITTDLNGIGEMDFYLGTGDIFGKSPEAQSASQKNIQNIQNQKSGDIKGGLPGIMIISPEEGSTIPSGNIIVSVSVTNFSLVNKLGASSIPREGHLHYYMDVPVPTTPGKPAVTATGTFAPKYETAFTWPSVAPGKHKFTVQLVNNDHTPVIPLVYATVNVTVI